MATVSLTDFRRQWAQISDGVLSAVARVGASGWYILGRELAQLEGALARRWSTKYAVGCGSGLDALEIALRALGVGAGDKVLTTPVSAFATTLAIIRIGAVPVFVDVDDAGLIDLDQAETAVARHSDIRCVVPVHLFGHCVDLERLAALRARFDVRLVEDCAQAIDAGFGPHAAGTVGQVGATSFYPTKNLGCLGDGGALVTDGGDLAERARRLRDYGQSDKYVHGDLGLNSRLDELQAAILHDVLLPRLSQWTERRRDIARAYTGGIRHPRIAIPTRPAASRSTWHLFPVLVRGDRSDFQRSLQGQGVATAIHYPFLIPDQGALKAYGSYEILGPLTRAADFVAREVSLPIHPFLSDAEVQQVIDACNAWDG